MSSGTKAISSDETALDLVSAFAESNDAQLRANAVQGLVVLAAGTHGGTANRAEDLLARTLAAGPPSAELEWQRRFRARALDSLQELDPEKREHVLEQVLSIHRQSADRNQRAAAGTLLFESIAKGFLSVPSWGDLRRLMFSAGAPDLWIAAKAVAWRTALALLAFSLLAYAMSSVFEMEIKTAAAQLLNLGVVLVPPLIALTSLSFAGRMDLPLRFRAIDTSVSGGAFAIMCCVGAWFLLGSTSNSVSSASDEPNWALLFDVEWRSAEISVWGLFGLAILGFVVGASVRLVKWLPNVTRFAAAPVRTLWAALFVTVACMAAAILGMDARAAGAAWIALVPAATVTVALDVWLERYVLDVATPSKAPRWSWAALLAVTALFFVVGTYHNISTAWPEKLPPLISRQVNVPDDFKAGIVEHEGPVPILLLTQISEPARYTISASALAKDDDIKLFIDGPSLLKRTIDEDNLDNGEEFTFRSQKGPYSICVLDVGDENNCKSWNYQTGQVDIVSLAGLLIARHPLVSPSEDIDDKSVKGKVVKQYQVKITIFRAGKRPPDLPPLKSKP